MAMKITEECIACGACVPECPTDSITKAMASCMSLMLPPVSNAKATSTNRSAWLFARSTASKKYNYPAAILFLKCERDCVIIRTSTSK